MQYERAALAKRERPRTRCRRHAAAGLVALLLFPAAAAAAPSADLWPRWERHDPASAQSVDHDDWDTLLARYLRAYPDGVHRFRYAHVSDADRERLDRYLTHLSGVAVSAHNRSEQAAFWINLYNALTVRVVLRHYPVSSIREIDLSPGLFAVGPWRKPLIRVEGVHLSLDDIEHRILRPIWRDPRIHYAVNCAALGCPNLQLRAFRATDLEARLEAGARAYINHPRGVSRGTRGWTLSKIYKWFRADFGEEEHGILVHLQRFAEPALAEKLELHPQIWGYEYDWSLNDAELAP